MYGSLPPAVAAPVAVLGCASRLCAVGAGDVVGLELAGALADLHFEFHAFAFAQAPEPAAQNARLVHEHVVEFSGQRLDEAEPLSTPTTDTTRNQTRYKARKINESKESR